MSSTNSSNSIRVGTRSSDLAQYQTNKVIGYLKGKYPQTNFEIVFVKTAGDKDRTKPIPDLGERGVFVKELEEALFADEVDFVVHSLKDLPTDIPQGLILASVLNRADPRDALIAGEGTTLLTLKQNAVVATSSRRRAAQLLAIRPDLKLIDIRGNVPTRVKKFEEGHCDAIVLAAAGLTRLGLESKISEYLDPEICTPACGQGALAIECRENDRKIYDLVSQINDPIVEAEVLAERQFLDHLGGGCSVPIGVLGRADETGKLSLYATVASLDGRKIIREQADGILADSQRLGLELACEIMEIGAKDILDELKLSTPNNISPP